MAQVVADELAEIQLLWPRFEALVGLRGRKMYAMVDTARATYAACTPVLADDDPDDLGLERGELPGGAFLCGRLKGAPPSVYDLIGPAVGELEASVQPDRSRPVVEFYRRHDEIELWLPVSG